MQEQSRIPTPCNQFVVTAGLSRRREEPNMQEQSRIPTPCNQFRGSLLLAAIIAGALVVAGPAQAADYLKNGSMKATGNAMPPGWRLHLFPGLETIGKAATIQGVTADSKAIELTWQSGSARFAVEAELARQPEDNNHYALSGKVRTTGDGKAAFLVECTDAKGVLLRFKETLPVSGEDWQDLNMLFSVPRGTKATRVFCLNVGAGSAAFAAIDLRPAAEGGAAEFPLHSIAIPAEGNAPIFGGKATFHSFIDSPCTLGFQLWGDTERVKDPALILDIPEELILAAAEHSETNLTVQPVDFTIETVEQAGRKFTRVTFPIASSRIKARPARCGRVNVIIDPKDPQAAVGKTFLITWRVSSGGELSGASGLEIKFLAPMSKTPNPTRFHYISWKSHDLLFNSTDMLDRFARRYEEAGMNNWPLHPHTKFPICRQANDFFRSRGWACTKAEPSHLHTVVTTFVKTMPEAKYVHTEKGVDTSRICPTYFNNDEDFRKKLREFYRQIWQELPVRPQDAILLDYEPWNQYEWCLCEDCRSHFAKTFNLGGVPTVAELSTKYREQWNEFKHRETDDHIRTMCDIARQAVPGVKVGIFGYVRHQDPKMEKWFKYHVALDMRRVDDYVDFHMLSCYHYNGKYASDLIDYNVKLLKKPVWMISNISRGDIMDGSWTRAGENLTPSQVGLKLLGAAASGAVGFATFPGWEVDGLFFVSIDRAMAQVAALEDFYLDGTRVDNLFSLTGRNIDDVVMRAHQHNGQVVITLINHDKTKAASISIKAVDKGKLAKLTQAYSPLGAKLSQHAALQLRQNGLKLVLEPLSEQFIVLASQQDEKIKMIVAE
jgi:hypothetical protein